MKDPKDETEEEEAEPKDTPAKEKEEGEYDSEEGIIPEKFQKCILQLVNECKSKECLSFIRECVYRKENELRRQEMKKESKGKSKIPNEYSTADMPL